VRCEEKHNFRKRLALHRITRDDPAAGNVAYFLYNTITRITPEIQKENQLSNHLAVSKLAGIFSTQQSDQQSFHASHTKDQSLMMIDGEEKLSRHNGVSHIESARSGMAIKWQWWGQRVDRPSNMQSRTEHLVQFPSLLPSINLNPLLGANETRGAVLVHSQLSSNSP